MTKAPQPTAVLVMRLRRMATRLEGFSKPWLIPARQQTAAMSRAQWRTYAQTCRHAADRLGDLHEAIDVLALGETDHPEPPA